VKGALASLPGLSRTSSGCFLARTWGLAAASACWWDADALTAVCLYNVEAVSRPVVKHLKQFARIAVPKIL
jgi:hypothetical protein